MDYLIIISSKNYFLINYQNFLIFISFYSSLNPFNQLKHDHINQFNLFFQISLIFSFIYHLHLHRLLILNIFFYYFLFIIIFMDKYR